jgi:TolB-like protein
MKRLPLLSIIALLAGFSGTFGQTPPVASVPPCSTAACALESGLALLDSRDTLRAYAVFAGSGTFDARDNNRTIMARYAALLKPAADRLTARRLLTQPGASDTATLNGSIAVAPFINAGAPENLKPLSLGFAEMLSTDLAQVRRFTVVEQSQVCALAREMALSQTGLLDTAYGERLGRLTRAAWTITGSFSGTDSVISVTAGTFSPLGAVERKSHSAQGRLAELFNIEKDLVFALIKGMGIVLTDDERRGVETVPTESVLAYLAYCKGLEAESAGDFPGAASHYGDAVKHDPGFKKAQAGCDRARQASAFDDERKKRTNRRETGGAKPTPVFTLGFLHLSPVSAAGIASMNRAVAGFMPERPLAPGSGMNAAPSGRSAQGGNRSGASSAQTERNSFLDATNAGPGSGTNVVKARTPVPPAVNNN